ncbi:Gfo/Idh/MocA family oxidoreductase [Streptomyces sp. NPDC050509]|uniref:Gfo/Idh/MocA family protein n=1 Tax=Streptomyces sp. NPDC050509 TaxID=3365620 RepID=UPI00379DCD23
MSVIRTAVIGFGTAGRVFHAPLVAANPRYALDAIVTGSPERAQAARETYPETDVIAYMDTLFARADQFDLVIIGSPNESHAPLARAAIEAGAHVVVDKPIAVTAAEARDIAAAAKAAGRVLTVFQNRRWDGDFLTLREVIARGELGEVHEFDSAFQWWNPQVGTGWKDLAGPDAGGGILYDLGPHLIDQALQLFGEITDVHAELDFRRSGGVNDDDSFLTLRHASGVRTRLWMSAVAPAPRPRFRVTGSRAVFRSTGLDPQEAQSIAGRKPGEAGFGLHDDGRAATVEGPEGAEAVPLRAGDYREFYRLLAAALSEGGPLPVDPIDSIRALEIIEQAIRNSR